MQVGCRGLCHSVWRKSPQARDKSGQDRDLLSKGDLPFSKMTGQHVVCRELGD